MDAAGNVLDLEYSDGKHTRNIQLVVEAGTMGRVYWKDLGTGEFVEHDVVQAMFRKYGRDIRRFIRENGVECSGIGPDRKRGYAGPGDAEDPDGMNLDQAFETCEDMFGGPETDDPEEERNQMGLSMFEE